MKTAKFFTIFFTFILIFSAFGTNILSRTADAAFSPTFDLYSEGVYMVNLDTNIVVASKNPDKRLYPASTAKIMTCLVALENVKDFNAKVDCDYKCFNEFWGDNPNYYNASNAAIEGEQSNLTFNDCMYALMIRSGCEAANIIAYNVCNGDIDAFIDLMNKTATKIGCQNTHFSNTHGLFDENTYTTAYDMYLITRYAIDKYPGFMRYCSADEYDMPANTYNPDGYTIYSTNRMMATESMYYTAGVKGIKTGSINEYNLKKGNGWDSEAKDGFCSLVTMCEKDGYKYLLVTLQAPYYDTEGESQVTHFEDHKKLYEWAYSEFERKQIIGENEQVMMIDVIMGRDTDKVGVVTTESFSTLIPKSLDSTAIQQIVPTVDPYLAPIKKGEPVGELVLKLNGETLTTIPLVIEEEVVIDTIAKYKDRVKTVMTSPGVVASIVIFFVTLIAFLVSRFFTKKMLAKNADMQRRRKIQMAPKKK
ncbi:MAG: D-alanyl-D-alanine carboxypeptidase [Oscillospiraceae bacterium]|nr:D-alanyl-D-alanine carboxypeptidase [Oscillospiraceae bacterium]